MSAPKRPLRLMVAFGGMALALLGMTYLATGTPASAQPADLAALAAPDAAGLNSPAGAPAGADPATACAGGPVIDGVTLTDCVDETFTVGGTSKTVRVWYTTNVATATRTVDGSTVTLSHWISNTAQAQQVATWGRQAWERYYFIFGRHPFNDGCSNRINVQMEDGVGWAGIAYWASSGSCRIGIDSPMVRNGGGQWVVYHEFGHYQQYSFNSGCYGYLRPNYPADSEFVEGYADLVADAVTTTTDAAGYSNAVAGYDPTTSMYDKGYGNVYNKYFIEQLGTLYSATDPWHHMDANLRHYQECDNQDTLYVLDDLIPAMKPGMTEEKFFLDFFGANWAKDWASSTTQPELVYTDDDGNSYGQIALAQNVSLASGSQNWTGQSIASTWAGKYYQVRPTSACKYVTAGVLGSAGARLSINLMAAKTTAPTSVLRTAWIGQGITRTFAAGGVYDRIVASVNRSDASGGTFDVKFACVTPVVDIVEPRQTNFALVGEPSSPTAFLARFKVTSGGAPVRGLPASSFSAQAEGAAVTIVTGTLQEVGEEYWAVMLPPTKTVGTTFVDLRVCLDTSICDTETHALLYVAPGKTDFALVFDASGSMATEDIIGEGTRVENAKRAGTVLADLLRDGDRVAVTDFSAFDSPAGCGIPYGSGNCALDLRTRLARMNVTAPVATAIATVKSAINLISARDWTPIGAALKDAKDKLIAAPTSDNPKHIILLSDGEENVNPLYAAVSAELIASGVVVDTIAFSQDAPAALLGQIAAETGGTMRFVPTTSGTMAQASPEQIAQATSLGLPADLVQGIMTAPLPGHLALADVYDYFETKGQDASRLFHDNYLAVPNLSWREKVQFVDGFATSLRLVSSGKQYDASSCGGYHREVEVLPADAKDPQRGWIPISPPDATKPASWDVRNSPYDDVVIIPSPAPGTWKMRTRHYWDICVNGVVDAEATARATSVQAFETDFMMNGSVESDIRVQGRFLAPIVNNQGLPGDRVPIVATVFSRLGAVPGMIVLAAIEKPGAVDLIILWDDGLHNDAAAADGIYGNTYSLTNIGGTYNVRIVAYGWDPFLLNWAMREWLGSFWIRDVYLDDKDKDGMPDTWERACGLNPNANDVEGDLDHDGLVNILEFHYGTIPCDPDTDDGGENDGSEVQGGRNPLYGPDDLVRKPGHFNVRALNGFIRIQWTRPLSYTGMTVFVSTDPGAPGQGTNMGTGGTFEYRPVTNDQTYYLTFRGITGTAQSDDVGPFAVTPKADPDAPSGAMAINGGAPSTSSRNVVLNLSATDTPLEGMATSASAGLGGGPLALAYNTVSAGVEMRISNDPSFAGAQWEPLATTKPWVLVDPPSGNPRVYAQFRDAALNESLVFWDDIVLDLRYLYLPIVLKSN